MAYLTMVGGRLRRPLPNASVSRVEVRQPGERVVTAVGLDPSAQAELSPEVQFQAARVALEEAASWHPATD
jgi:hypothetical protein